MKSVGYFIIETFLASILKVTYGYNRGNVATFIVKPYRFNE